MSTDRFHQPRLEEETRMKMTDKFEVTLTDRWLGNHGQAIKRIIIDLDAPEDQSPAKFLNNPLPMALMRAQALDPCSDLKPRDCNQAESQEVREIRSAMDKPKGFSGLNLEDLLKNSRKRFFGIELLKNEQSLLSRYKPVKISTQKAAITPGFEGSLEDCFKLGKRADSTFTEEKCPEKDNMQENIEPQLSRQGHSLATPGRIQDSLSLIMSKSIKKLSKIEQEKADEVVRERYTPRKFQPSVSNCDPLDANTTLEDVLKNSKKKSVRFGVDIQADLAADDKQSCTEKAAEYASQRSNRGKEGIIR